MKSFKDSDWKKHWAGNWGILSSTYLGHQYTKLLKETLGSVLGTSVFVSKQGYTVCSLEKEGHKRFGKSIAQKIITDENQAVLWSKELKIRTDQVLSLIEGLKDKRITKEDYYKFIKALINYGSPHRAVKVSVDFLPSNILKKHLPVLSEARVYAEPVYEQTEIFFQRYAQQISKETGYNPELIIATTKDEFEKFLYSGKLPKKEVLEKRFNASAVIFEDGKCQIVEDVVKLEKDMENSAQEIKGSTAFSGKVKGKVRVILNPKNVKDFNKGDILVAGMTRPEYVHLIEKSAAFVTDAGGILCHASITAREMKKPCIVGTEIATKVLKDGDYIEVDADKGIVRKIK